MFFTFAQIFGWLINYKYIILVPLVMLEGPLTIMTAGFLSSLNVLDLLIAFGVIVLSDISGDIIYYSIGHWGGEKFISRWGKYIGMNLTHVKKIEHQFQKRGKILLFWGKISHVFGAIVMVSAGISKVRFKHFVFFIFFTSLIKSAILLLIGYYFGRAYASINKYFEYSIIIILILVLAAIIINWFIKKYLDKAYEADE